MQSTLSPAELVHLIETIAGPDDVAHIAYKAMSPMWRGAYGPFVVVSGRFARGGDFEFAIRVDHDAIDLAAAGGRKKPDIYLVD
jgi:hypothetical protein